MCDCFDIVKQANTACETWLKCSMVILRKLRVVLIYCVCTCFAVKWSIQKIQVRRSIQDLYGDLQMSRNIASRASVDLQAERDIIFSQLRGIEMLVLADLCDNSR